MVSKFGSKKILGAPEQLARITLKCPNFKGTIHRKGKLVAIGEVQPTERSKTYTIRLEYCVGDSPKTFVISPPLVTREEGVRIPHLYSQEKFQLCLYLPGAREWLPELSLWNTIIPWISDWLFYYEVWHITGEWLGGGVEPETTETIKNDSEAKDEIKPRESRKALSNFESRRRRH